MMKHISETVALQLTSNNNTLRMPVIVSISFSMPYWDVTNDGEYWLSTTGPQIEDIPLYNSNLGGEGDIANDYCVTAAPWNLDYYNTESLCSEDEEPGQCCLKRLHTDGTGDLFGRSDFGQLTFNESLANFTKYSQKISTWHGEIHLFIGSVESTHFHPTTGYQNGTDGEPTEDPLFALFHAFIDYIQMMRADCNQYDLVNADDLDAYEPWAYDEFGGCSLDYLMDFSVLCEEGTDRFCTENPVTPRIMFDLSPNGPFDVVYELGDFWHQNEELQRMCAANLNDTWWHDEDSSINERFEFVAPRAHQRGGSLMTIAVFTVGIFLVFTIGMICTGLSQHESYEKIEDKIDIRVPL